MQLPEASIQFLRTWLQVSCACHTLTDDTVLSGLACWTGPQCFTSAAM